MNILDFKRKKQQHQKITMLTCYDYPSARLIAESNIDCILVGDSVAMVVHGYPTTVNATMEMMVMHTEAVARGVGKQFLISDLPFLSYRTGIEATVAHVARLMQAGAQGIKLEGADEDACATIRYLVNSGVPVMGHIGLTPQSVHQLGGWKVQGKKESEARRLLDEAKALEDAGCFAVVLECMPQAVAEAITEMLSIPTIGIGASMATDGQVLVWHDVLGLQTEYLPKFVKQYLPGKEVILNAINDYAEQVQQAHFPAEEHTYS